MPSQRRCSVGRTCGPVHARRADRPGRFRRHRGSHRYGNLDTGHAGRRCAAGQPPRPGGSRRRGFAGRHRTGAQPVVQPGRGRRVRSIRLADGRGPGHREPPRPRPESYVGDAEQPPVAVVAGVRAGPGAVGGGRQPAADGGARPHRSASRRRHGDLWLGCRRRRGQLHHAGRLRRRRDRGTPQVGGGLGRRPMAWTDRRSSLRRRGGFRGVVPRRCAAVAAADDRTGLGGAVVRRESPGRLVGNGNARHLRALGGVCADGGRCGRHAQRGHRRPQLRTPGRCAHQRARGQAGGRRLPVPVHAVREPGPGHPAVAVVQRSVVVVRCRHAAVGGTAAGRDEGAELEDVAGVPAERGDRSRAAATRQSSGARRHGVEVPRALRRLRVLRCGLLPLERRRCRPGCVRCTSRLAARGMDQRSPFRAGRADPRPSAAVDQRACRGEGGRRHGEDVLGRGNHLRSVTALGGGRCGSPLPELALAARPRRFRVRGPGAEPVRRRWQPALRLADGA